MKTTLAITEITIDRQGMREESRSFWARAIESCTKWEAMIALVQDADGEIRLVDGRHRLEAAQGIGWATVYGELQIHDDEGRVIEEGLVEIAL